MRLWHSGMGGDHCNALTAEAGQVSIATPVPADKLTKSASGKGLPARISINSSFVVNTPPPIEVDYII